MFSTDKDSEPIHAEGQTQPQRQHAHSWLYRLAEQSGFGQLAPQAQDSHLPPPDFDQRVRQVGEW